jgi:2-iminobutanoate/2-iminopropanoate deaminase
MATQKKVMKPEGIRVNPYFSPAIRMGQFIFVSGQVGVDDDGNAGDTAAQSELAILRVKAILESEGASLSDVVLTTNYLTPEADPAAFNSMRGKYYPQDPPASATVIVAALLRADLVVETQVVAMLPDGS